MDNPVIRRVCREVGVPDLLERLSERVSASDLQALLLELARMRAARRNPAELMAQYERDRTVRAGGTNARALARLVVAAFDAVPDYDAVELAPVEPVGLNSVLAGIDQNNVLATVRATEVVADPTVALALQAAWRRRHGSDVVRMCAAHRVLRQQAFALPALQHFHIFALVTGARSQSDHRSEVDAMGEHVHAHLAITAAARELGAPVEQAVVRISDTAVHTAATRAGVAVRADVSSPHDAIPPDVARRLGRRLRRLEAAIATLTPIVAGFGGRLLVDLTRTDGVRYYDGLQLRIDATWQGAAHEVADGGSVDWAARLLSDRREHLFTSGMGLERLLPRHP
ncbi:MAG TPA: hypothetical protein VIM27_01705 [Gaiellales bacterium]|jgi:hypothetical protein